MRDFKELSWSEGVETVMALLPRLTVMRSILDTEPMKTLYKYGEAVIEGNIRAAVDALFKMTGELAKGPCRRVTGELFMDFILDEVFNSKHPFALMAAANLIDEAVYNGMREDLDILFSLSELDGGTLYRFIQERYRELKQKARPSRDLATRVSEAAWGGNAVRPPEDENMPPQMKLPAFLPASSPNWQYGEAEMRDSYVSDEAMEEMYHRFIESDGDWSALVENLWNFFASYGCGEFLRYRMFTWLDGTLAPMQELRETRYIKFLEPEYRRMLNHIIGFMRSEHAEPILLTGAEGMGKTSMLMALSEELPELRFVYVRADGFMEQSEINALFKALKDQPLKFMVVVDDVSCFDVAVRTVPMNVLLVVTAQAAPCGSFTAQLSLPVLRLEAFSDIVYRLCGINGTDVSKEAVRSACAQKQTELTVAAAVRMAKELGNS